VGLVEASESGDRRATLEALRDRLARAVDNDASLSVLAPLANQLRAVLADLDEMPAKKGGSVVDDLAARRTDRRSAAQGGDLPAGGDVIGS